MTAITFAASSDPPVAVPVAVSAASFEDFVHSTGTRMMRTAVLLTGNPGAAEDLVQSTYTHLFAKWRQVQRADHPLAYARKAMLRLHLDERRRRRVVEVHTETEPAPHAPDHAMRLSLAQALATLSPLDRAVVVLRHWEDLSVNDTAQQLGISPIACRTRAHRALKQLRTQFPSLADSED